MVGVGIMNDLEKARALLESKRYRLKDIHEYTGISSNSLTSYSARRIKLENAAWKTVYKLARYYDQVTDKVPHLWDKNN